MKLITVYTLLFAVICLAIFIFFWVKSRLKLLRDVASIEDFGAVVVWDIDVISDEGGSARNETRLLRTLRLASCGTPFSVSFSDDYKGSHQFQSKCIRKVALLKRVMRLSVYDLNVDVDDLNFIIAHGIVVKSIGLYNTGIKLSKVMLLPSECTVEVEDMSKSSN